MDWEAYRKHKAFAGETKPSMLRRRIGHDYQSRRIYLITMTMAGRRPLLGTLKGDCDAPNGAEDAPHIELTELGKQVRSFWMAIEHYYPAIKVLAHPLRIQVRLSRRLTDDEIEQSVNRFLTMARGGAILVSPAISKGEKAVMRAAMNARYPLIFITPYGFNEFSHPGHQYYDACAGGRLLLLAPWPHQNRKEALTRSMCQQLNLMATAIATGNL